MIGNYILVDRMPVPISDIHEWAKWMEGNDASRRVAIDFIGGAKVSTVFLGIDYSFGGVAPLLFETMIFGGPLDGEQNRYFTWDEAVAGHNEMVKRVRA